jgi:hypothetical protein
LDGFADEDTQRHLAQCLACAARLQNMRQFDRGLQRRLKRFDCPSPQQLADYETGMLDAETSNIVHRHVAQCPRCLEDLRALEQFLDLPDEPVANNIIPFRSPKNVWKARDVQVSGNLALKGMEEETAHDANAGSATVFLESKQVPQGFMLTGQVVDSQVNWVGALAEARQEGASAQVHILDDIGEFSFEFTTPTSISLYITAASGITLIVENVTIQV